MAQQFFPTTTFEAVVNGRLTRYRGGQRYTCRDGPLYDDLRRQLQEWAADGRVRLGAEGAAGGPAIQILMPGG